jgi:hypothetical protein
VQRWHRVASPAIQHPYRASAAPPRATWRDWRTLVVVFVGCAWLVSNGPSSRTTLACDRHAGTCELTQETATERSARPVAIADLRGASLEVIRGARWLRQYRLTLDTPGAPIRLRPAGSQDRMQAFVDAVDAFARSPADAALTASYGSVWGRFVQWAIGLGVVFLAFAYSLPTVRVRVDRDAQRLLFDLRPFGPLLARHRSYPLASVREARVAVRGTPAWVELRMHDGSAVRLAGSVAPHGSCEVLAARINDVLRG